MSKQSKASPSPSSTKESSKKSKTAEPPSLTSVESIGIQSRPHRPPPDGMPRLMAEGPITHNECATYDCVLFAFFCEAHHKVAVSSLSKVRQGARHLIALRGRGPPRDGGSSDKARTRAILGLGRGGQHGRRGGQLYSASVQVQSRPRTAHPIA
jgi:hypothetical protein